MARSDQNSEYKSRRRTKPRSGRRVRKELARKIRGPLNRLWAVIVLPVKILFLPAQLIDLFYFRGLQTSRGRRRSKSLRRRAKSWWRGLLAVPYRVVSAALHRSRRGELIYFLPAFLAFAFVSYVSFQLSVHNQKIQARYNDGARSALLKGNLTLANTYFSRLFDRSSLSNSQRMQWVAVLRSAGELKRADALLNDLAPTFGAGYPQAHAVRAIELAAQIEIWRAEGDGHPSQGELEGAWVKSPDLNDIDGRLDELRVHLRCANDKDPRIHLAWAKYWFCRRDVGAACKSLEKAKKSRELFLEVARTANQRVMAGDLSTTEVELLQRVAQETLEESRNEFEGQLNVDPLNHEARIQLAAALVNQSKFKLAKQTLRTGIAFHADPVLRRGLADVFVIEYKNDQLRETDLLTRSDLEARVKQLKHAINADPNYLLPYVCLAKLLNETDQPHVSFSKSLEQEMANESLAIQTFRWLVTSDQPSVVDYLGLATLHWHRGDVRNAESHLRQACAMGPSFDQITHRFASAYAFFSETPDLVWARKLVDRSLQQSPDDPAVLLSHGRILLEQGEAELGVEQLLRSLKGAELPEEVHVAIEAGYMRMGDLELASKHGRLANAAKTRRLVNGLK